MRRYAPEVICGPLVEGAFVGLLVAEELGVEFVHAEPVRSKKQGSLFPVDYRIPGTLRVLENRRVAVVNDVVNAGSAVRGALRDLELCGADVVAIGALLTLGDRAATLAAGASIPLEALETQPNSVWVPNECPLCANGAPLTLMAVSER